MKRSRREHSALPWFILLSFILHHAVIVTCVRAPDLTRYERIEVEYVAHGEGEPAEPDEVALPPAIAPVEKTLAEKDVTEKEEKVKEPPPEPDPLEKKKQEKKKDEESSQAVTLVQTEGMHFVDVRDHEAEEPPPDAKYFAPINSKVDEETRAENTNLDVDQGASKPDSAGEPAEEPGNAEESLAAHLVEEQSLESEDGKTTEKPEDPDLLDATPSPAASEHEQGGTVAKKSAESEQIVLPALTPDTAPPVEIAKAEDGEILDLESGEPVPTFEEAKKAKEKKGGKSPGKMAKLTVIKPTWSQIEGVFGAEMEDMKKEWKEAKKAKKKGGFTGDIDKIMAQLENFNPEVKPGNQTALNAAYHPFAEFITAFHRNLHPHWGDGFLASLIGLPSTDPLSDMALWVKLEFVVLPDGSIEKVTVVRHSGNLVYDVAAIDAVYAGQPYPPPPDIIKSYNGKTYLRWGMHRNESQCGVWNAEPYIIVAPDEGDKPKLPKEKQPH